MAKITCTDYHRLPNKVSRWRHWSFALLVPLVVACFAATSTPMRAAAAGNAGGVVLDGLGGLHTFGGFALNTSGASYWNWDAARSVSVLSDGSGGWTLDAYGGVHAFGTAPYIATCDYWSGWDIARALVVTPDERGYYVLDGWGGVHNCGTAPSLPTPQYWQGWDIARGMAIHTTSVGVPDGVYTLDGYGGVHTAGDAPSVQSPEYFYGYDAYRGFHISEDSSGNVTGDYALAHYGIVEGFGSGSGIPTWNGFSTWGTWNITRDVVLVNTGGNWTPQLLPDRASAGAEVFELQNWARLHWGSLGGYQMSGNLINISGNNQGASWPSASNPCTPYDRVNDMLVRNYFSDAAIPECGNLQAAQVYPFGAYHSAGENIGYNSGQFEFLAAANNIINAWMNSPPHKANALSTVFNTSGCGVQFQYSTYTPQAPWPAASNVWLFSCTFAQY